MAKPSSKLCFKRIERGMAHKQSTHLLHIAANTPLQTPSFSALSRFRLERHSADLPIQDAGVAQG